jgi:putative protease
MKSSWNSQIPPAMTADLPTSDSSSTSLFRCPELLSPAGNWNCAKAAVENGADAIYFGLERFNARMRAENFTVADLQELMTFLHQRGVKGYVTLNTLVFADELLEAEQYLRAIITAGVDAIIVQDVGICRLIRHLSPDFPIHASTQMTVTSAAGVAFARSLGCQLVVLARECSLKEIQAIQQQTQHENMALPLEVFVHGALCVAYSGQCLTSEALGGRSANRGECAQACRMPYELWADGKRVELGDRQYLLSPQDLSGLEVLPDLVRTGVTSLKIEGRLKTPEYVATVTRVYRQALDRAMTLVNTKPDSSTGMSITPQERYQLEMAFSRGLYTGWFQGIDNQALVHARFGKKRGVYLGQVSRVVREGVLLHPEAPVKAGDGVVFDQGQPDQREVGGRIYMVQPRGNEVLLTFGRDAVDLRRIRVGDRLWKTSDPELEKDLRQSFAGEIPQFQRPIRMEVHGHVGQVLVAIAQDEQGHVVQVASEMPLVEAHSKPLTQEKLQEQLGRLGNTAYRLEHLTSHIEGSVMIPVSELNRMRRTLVQDLDQQRSQPKRWTLQAQTTVQDLLPRVENDANNSRDAELIVLVRSLPQLKAVLPANLPTIYCELEDPRQYQAAVQQVRQAAPETQIWVAPPRITKPGEQWILQQVLRSQADGYLIRNYDHWVFFRQERCVGDFSFNVANPITAAYWKELGLERLTASYDLNIQQLDALLGQSPPDWFEVTIHQHMPMFHMEHCVFCAFLSDGTDYTNCGRPCEQHQVTLRDRTGIEHVLRADAGCRNTLFNGTAQTGAEYVQRLLALGVRHFRVEFLNESPSQVLSTIQRYQELLSGQIGGTALWKELKLQHQLGVTRGPLDHRHKAHSG